VTAADVEPQVTAADPPAPDDGRPWRRAVRAAGLLWVISHVGYAVVFMIAFWSGGKAPALRNILAPWDRWDSKWLLQVATEGYADPNAAAFFPLYPLLVRVADVVLPGGALPPALLISNSAMLGALALLYRFVEREADRDLADRTTWYLIAFPTAFFLAVGYNESLFLLLSLGCVYLLRGRNWWLAGLVGGLAAATRSVGLLLLVPFAWEYLRVYGRRPKPTVVAAALIPAGLGAYMLYTWATLGDALAFVHAQRHWGRQLNWPWVSFGQTVRNLVHTRPVFVPDGAHLMLDLLATLVVLTLVVLAFVGPWKLRRDQWALGLYDAALAFTLISFPSTKEISPFPLWSAPRLALEIFPAFLVLARIGAGSRTADRVYLMAALALQGASIVQYLNGGWVA